MPTVLLACSPKALAKIEPAVADVARCVTVRSVEEAIARRPDIPFICCKVLDTELSGAGVHAAETAARNLGVTMFVDASGTRGIRQLADHLKAVLGTVQ